MKNWEQSQFTDTLLRAVSLKFDLSNRINYKWCQDINSIETLMPFSPLPVSQLYESEKCSFGCDVPLLKWKYHQELTVEISGVFQRCISVWSLWLYQKNFTWKTTGSFVWFDGVPNSDINFQNIKKKSMKKLMKIQLKQFLCERFNALALSLWNCSKSLLMWTQMITYGENGFSSEF